MLRQFILVFCCICGFLPAQLQAQQTIGVDWEVPDQSSHAAAELRRFSELGFTHLQVHEALDDETWQLIEELNFTVYGLLPVKFPTASTFTDADSTFRQRIDKLFNHYNSQNSVQAIGILSYGNWSNDSFRREAAHFTATFAADTDKETYYITTRDLSFSTDSVFTFRLLNQDKADTAITGETHYLYNPYGNGRWNLKAVKTLLNRTSSVSGSVLLFNSHWLQNMQSHYPGLNETLQLYATTEEAAFPLPYKSKVSSYSENIVVIMLIIAWIILAVVYNYNPVYRRSLLRYYSGHQFYVNDVMHRHIRSMLAASTILVQHAIAGGIVTFCVFNTGFSLLGLQALQFHYPILGIFGGTKLSIFLAGLLITLIVECIMILWLWVASIKSTYLNQIVNLYPWALQSNLILATVALGLYLAESSAILIYLSGILFACFFIGSFIITAFDLARNVAFKRRWFYAGTLGIYGFAVLGFIGWIFISSEVRQIVNLAVNLP